MRTKGITLPELLFIGGTRVALGAGLGLLISGKLNKDQRKSAGWALVAVGAVTTIPIVMHVRAKPRLGGESAA